jgi:hypothetical protein
MTCKVHSLAKFGDDPSIGKWIAETIPDMIQPGTWNDKRRVSYHAPTQILVVCHTDAVHAEVEAFLKNIKKAMPRKVEQAVRKQVKEPGVVPVSLVERSVTRPTDSSSSMGPGYPVPAQTRAPKHLFHFIIRYEGEGIVDDNVADVLKKTYGEKSAKDEPAAACSPVPTTVLPPTAAGESDNKTGAKPSTSVGLIHGCLMGVSIVPPPPEIEVEQLHTMPKLVPNTASRYTLPPD